MTREQLAKKSANEVRRDKVLFSLYKGFFQQDAHLIYSNGKPPGNCFGCSFNAHYRKWQLLYINNTKPVETMAKDNNTYILKDPAYRVYFKGEILSQKSDADKWKEWINHPKDSERIKARKALFSVLEKPALDDEAKAPKPRKKTQPKEASQDDKGDE